MIQNTPHIADQHTTDLRLAIEHRATWFYFLIDEAEKRGLDTSFAREAIRRCGCFHGENKFPRTDDLKEFAKAFAPEQTQRLFEMTPSVSDTEFSIDFHYCPLVAAWKKLTNDETKIAQLCDIAMDGDRGIISTYGKFAFELGQTIAKGDPVCQIRIKKTS